MRAAALVVLGWLLIGVQSSALHALPGVPDFLVPLAVYLGFTREALRAAALAGLLGYFADVLGGHPRGLHMVTAMFLSLVASLFSVRLYLRGILFSAFLTALGSVLSQLITIGLLVAFYPGFSGTDLLYAELLPALAATTLVGAPLFAACSLVDALGKKVDTRRFGTEGEDDD